MSVRLALAGDARAVRAGEAEMAAFLGRLVRWDKAAVVRLRSAAGEPALGVFGHPPFGDVLAVKSMALSGAGVADAVDATVSAGELLDAVAAAADGGEFTVPGSVTGPAWAGLLPPRSNWRRDAELEPARVREAAARTVAEFRARTEALLPEQRTRSQLDALAEELWRRPLPGSTAEVPLRIVHAAHALGFLQARPAQPDAPAADRGDSAQLGAPGDGAASCDPSGGDARPGEATAGSAAGESATADGAAAKAAASQAGLSGAGRTGAGLSDDAAANAVDADDAVAVLSAGPWLRLRTAYGSVAVRRASAATGLTVSPL